jgi:DNA-binding transcriptional LysR family regulator
MDHLIVSDSAAFEGMIDVALHSMGRHRRVVLSVHSYLLAPLIVSRSNLLVTLPRQLIEQHAAPLDLFDAPLPLPEVTLKAFWHDRTHDDPVNRRARSQLFNASPR